MNAAVGKNAPPWLCIEGMDYSVIPASSDSRKNHESKLIPLEPPPEGYLGAHEAADIFGISAKSIARVSVKEKMSRVILRREHGRCAFILASDLEAYFARIRRRSA